MSSKSAGTSQQAIRIAPVWWVFWLCSLVAVLVTGLLIIGQVSDRKKIYHEILELRSQQDQALAEFTRLQIERGTDSSYERVVRVASSDLSMKFPDKIETLPSDEKP